MNHRLPRQRPRFFAGFRKPNPEVVCDLDLFKSIWTARFSLQTGGPSCICSPTTITVPEYQYQTVNFSLSRDECFRKTPIIYKPFQRFITMDNVFVVFFCFCFCCYCCCCARARACMYVYIPVHSQWWTRHNGFNRGGSKTRLWRWEACDFVILQSCQCFVFCQCETNSCFIFRVSAGTFMAICIEIHVCTTLDLESSFFTLFLWSFLTCVCFTVCLVFLLRIVFIRIAKAALFMLVKWYTPTPPPSPPPPPPPSLLTLRFDWSGEQLTLGKLLKYVSTSRIYRDREHTRARTHWQIRARSWGPLFGIVSVFRILCRCYSIFVP